MVFPQFATYGPLPHHGLVRTRVWRVTAAESRNGRARATLIVEDCAETRELWPHSFAAELSVSVGNDWLDIRLRIENSGRAPLEFTTALHTYLRVENIAAVRLEGLRGIRYRDRTRNDREAEETAEAIAIGGEFDRIYLDAPNTLRLHELDRSLVICAECFPDAVGGISVGEVMRTIMPFYAALIAALFIVTYVPAFSLLLPRLVLGYQG